MTRGSYGRRLGTSVVLGDKCLHDSTAIPRTSFGIILKDISRGATSNFFSAIEREVSAGDDFRSYRVLALHSGCYSGTSSNTSLVSNRPRVYSRLRDCEAVRVFNVPVSSIQEGSCGPKGAQGGDPRRVPFPTSL